MAIQFDQWFFSNPVAIDVRTPVGCAALYAILIPDETADSLPFRAIYFGEAESLAKPDFFRSHPKHDDWVREAGSQLDLYVSTHLCAGMSAQYREFVTGMLIREYEPACNELALRR